MQTETHRDAGDLTDHRLPRAFRLRRRFEFLRVQSRGRGVHSPHFVLVVLQDGHPYGRLGITVTRKVSPSAVCRNRLKRRIREVYRRNRGRFPNGATVVIAKRGAHELSYAAVSSELLTAGASARRRQRNGSHAPQTDRPRTGGARR